MALWWSSMDANNWDLQAVVRLGCCPSFPSSTSIRDPFSSVGRDPFVVDLVEEINPVPDPVQTQNVIHELEELCKPFISAGQTAAPAAPSPPPVVPPQPVQPVRQPPPANRAAGRKRKKQQKKVVCQVPADVHPSDMWAWRKYGQKPIKGSPYPRGYYRCSSSKVCTARKQVERSRTDPSMLIVTYTGEHNHPVPTHRNSLAGSTRNKYPQNLGSSSNEDKTEGLSPTTPLVGSTEEENEGGDEDQDDGATNSFGLVDMMGNFDDEMAFLDSEGFDDEGSDELVKRFFSDSWEVDSLSTAIGN